MSQLAVVPPSGVASQGDPLIDDNSLERILDSGARRLINNLHEKRMGAPITTDRSVVWLRLADSERRHGGFDFRSPRRGEAANGRITASRAQATCDDSCGICSMLSSLGFGRGRRSRPGESLHELPALFTCSKPAQSIDSA